MAEPRIRLPRGLMMRIVSRVLVRTRLCRLLTIPQQGFKLRFYPTALSSALWRDPSSAQTAPDLIRAYVRPGDTVVDVGANIGSTAIPAALAVGPNGRVYAFEPHPRIYRYLRGNLSLNEVRNVEAENIALGEVHGLARLQDRVSDEQNRISPSGDVQVSVLTLDEVAPQGKIALVKIDTEGFELMVLRGGEEALRRTAAILFEVDPAHYATFGYRAADVFQFLQSRGFRLVEVGAEALYEVDVDEEPSSRENYFAVRSIDDLAARTGRTLGRRG